MRQFVRRKESRGSSRFEASHLKSEEGFILLMVLFLAVLLIIALAVAAPRVAISIQRDKEIELVHRGEQYKRAIKLYYKRFGAYPTSIDQLLNTNNVRFLRKRYKDPITGKDDWRLIYLGQAKVPLFGFFGEPLTGLGGATNIGTPVSATSEGATTGTSGFGSSAFGSSGGSSAFGSSSGTGSSGFGSSNLGSSGFSSSGEDSSTTGASTASTDGSSSTDSGSGTNSTLSGTATSGTGTSAFGSSGSGSNSPISGGPIVGVGIPSTKASLIDYKKQKHYNQWEFVYNPMEDQMMAAAGLASGVTTQNGTSGTAGGFGSNTGNSGGFGSSAGGDGGFGSSTGSSGTGFGGTANSPTSPTGPSTDQQQ
jgi:type II secretory pathway pseudopilin PulG